MANPFPTLPICVTRKTIHDKATFPSDIKYVRTYDIPSISPTIPTGKGTALNLTSGVILLMLSDNNLNQHEKKNHNTALHSNSRRVITHPTLWVISLELGFYSNITGIRWRWRRRRHLKLLALLKYIAATQITLVGPEVAGT